MKRSVAIYLFVVACFLLVFLNAVQLYAQPNITYLGIEQGLSNNSVRSIYQDKKGFMWFCTYDGLNRYDGYGFKIFRNDINDTNSLFNNVVTSIAEDKNNHFWIGTRQGLSKLDALIGRFTSLSYSSANKKIYKVDNVVKDVKIDNNNNALIGCEGLGLLFSSNGSSIAKQIPFTNRVIETTAYGVQTIKVDFKNRVWALVQNKGLCVLDYKTMKLTLINSAAPSATCLEIDKDGIWMGAAGSIYFYNTSTNTAVKVLDAVKDKLTSPVIVALSKGKKNNLWIGTNGGGINIYNITSKKINYLQAGDNKNVISSDAVYSIYFDNEARTWLGTLRGGVNIIDPQKDRFTTIAHDYANANSLHGNFIFSFLENTDSSIWIGTDGKGLINWNRKKNIFTTYLNNPVDIHSLPGNTVTCLRADFNNDMWLTSTAGVARYNKASKNFERFKCINGVTGFESKSFQAIYEDKNHNLWVGALREGSNFGALYLFNRTLNKFEVFDGTLSDLFSIYEDKSGAFWGGNLNQLVSIDRIHRQHRFYDIGNSVRALYDDSKGNFWIGTEGGGLILFSRKDNKILRRYTTNEGLCNNSVLGILEDKQGNLWMSTYNGLAKFNINKKVFTNFYQSDGLQSNEFHYNASLALRSGEFLFGGIKGFNVFYPDKINLVNMVPNLVFTGLTINNKPIEQDNSFITKSSNQIQEIKVPYNEAILSIDFTALEYFSPNKISYAYYLQNWDDR